MTPKRLLSSTQCQMLAMEEKTAAFYLIEGTNSLSSLQKSTSFYPMAFGLVASGLERLLKLNIILGALHDLGLVPSRSDFRKLSHDLMTLSERALDSNRKPARSAQRFLRQDEVLSTLLSTLSDFAKDGRYLYMDRILDPNRQSSDPARNLRVVEDAIFRMTSDSGVATESWLFGCVLRGEIALYVRRRNEFILESLLAYLALLTKLFIDLAGTGEAGYLRIFLAERTFGRPPGRNEFRRVANSPELDRWEASLLDRFAIKDAPDV